MSGGRDKLVERQILKAQAEGKLSGLDGEGKPLPAHPEEAHVDPAEAAGFRIMAEAGAVPEEIALARAVEEAKAAYRAARGTDGEKAAMARVADLQMKHAIARDARRKFLGG